MNTKKLKEAEDYFFELYPKGVEDENLLPIIKKHNTAKIGQAVQEMFVKDNFATPKLICENFSKIVSKSTLVSIFEKPKVRDMVKRMSIEQEDMLSIGLYELLYGNKSSGFDILVNVLAHYGLAKWSLVTLIPYYYARNKEFFIKPNTTKNIIKFFELEGLVYKPKPSYEFYMQYKAQLEKMKSYINSGVGDDNAGFTGFLMIAMEE